MAAPALAQVFSQPLNNASSTLASNYTAASGSMTVASGTGARFGTPSSGAPVRITVAAKSTLSNGQIAPTTVVTIYTVTARSGDTLSGLTPVEGTSDRGYTKGDPVAVLVTAGMIADLQTGTASGGHAGHAPDDRRREDVRHHDHRGARGGHSGAPDPPRAERLGQRAAGAGQRHDRAPLGGADRQDADQHGHRRDRFPPRRPMRRARATTSCNAGSCPRHRPRRRGRAIAVTLPKLVRSTPTRPSSSPGDRRERPTTRRFRSLCRLTAR